MPSSARRVALASQPARRGGTAWGDLGVRARVWRILHATWSVAQLTCLGLIWQRVIARRRDRALWLSVGFLMVEGGALVIGRGDCPVGGLQEEWGDPVPFFELVLPPRAAKAAVPVLAVISAAAIAAVVLRSPGLGLRAYPTRRAPLDPSAGRRAVELGTTSHPSARPR